MASIVLRVLRFSAILTGVLLGISALLVGLVQAAETESKTSNTRQSLSDRTIERRAVEAAIWGMPIVNYDLMRQEMLTKTDGKVNQVVYWGRPLDWRNQTRTPNPAGRSGGALDQNCAGQRLVRLFPDLRAGTGRVRQELEAG